MPSKKIEGKCGLSVDIGKMSMNDKGIPGPTRYYYSQDIPLICGVPDCLIRDLSVGYKTILGETKESMVEAIRRAEQDPNSLLSQEINKTRLVKCPRIRNRFVSRGSSQTG